MWCHAVLRHGGFYSNVNQCSFMQASFYIILHNGFSMNFSICGSSAWWSRVRMVLVTALDFQVSLRNPTVMLEDSLSVKTLCMKIVSSDIASEDTQYCTFIWLFLAVFPEHGEPAVSVPCCLWGPGQSAAQEQRLVLTQGDAWNHPSKFLSSLELISSIPLSRTHHSIVSIKIIPTKK